MQGLSIKDIGKVVDKHETKIAVMLKHFKPVFSYIQHVESYRQEKSTLLDAAEALALKSLCDKLLENDGNLQQTAIAFREIFRANHTHKHQASTVTASITFCDLPDSLKSLMALPVQQALPEPDKS